MMEPPPSPPPSPSLFNSFRSGSPVNITIKNLVRHGAVHWMGGCPIVLSTSNPIDEFIASSTPAPSSTFSDTIIAYETRYRSFEDWTLNFITPRQMANAGLTYMGVQDRVKCTYCDEEFDYWQRGDDPLVEHKRRSPHCMFFRESDGFDVCGLYESIPNPETNIIENVLYSAGIIQYVSKPTHKEFASIKARRETFEKMEIDMKQDRESLCEAGFFYIGDGRNDHLLCFHCNIGLTDWGDDEEPWTEHALWSPTCEYVLLSKGKNFVDEVRGLSYKVPKIDQEEFLKLIADNNDVPVLENNIKINSIKKKTDHEEITENNQIEPTLPESITRPSQQDANATNPDTLMCKICYKKEMEMAFIPCGHVYACVQCAMNLDPLRCPICRMPFGRALRVFFCMDNENGEDLDVACSESQDSESQCSDKPSGNILCKVCLKKEVGAAFIPCRHVYACVECATELHECPECSEKNYGTIQVFL